MARIFEYRLVVSPEAIDENGHANNVAYVRWMQEVAVLHSNAQGATRELYRQLGTTWVARSHYIEYLRPAFKGEEIAVYTWVADRRRSSSLRKYKFMRVADEVVLARAETLWVYVDQAGGRPVRLHEEVMGLFELVPADEEPGEE